MSVKDRKKAVLQKHGGRLGILLKQENERPESSANESEGIDSQDESNQMTGPAAGRSLLDQHSELKKKEEGKATASVVLNILSFLDRRRVLLLRNLSLYQ